MDKNNIPKNHILICLMGIDGSGKTTLAKALLQNLRKNGIDTIYRWGKVDSLLLRLIIFVKNILIIREKNWKVNYKKSLEMKKKLFRNNLISKLYEYFILFTYAFQLIFKILLPLKMGKTIICDRYVYDTIVDLAQDLDYSEENMKHRLGQLFNILPLPDILFFIDVPEDVAFRRKNDIVSLNFLKTKKERYIKILEILRVEGISITVIDGTCSVPNLKKQALATLSNYLRI